MLDISIVATKQRKKKPKRDYYPRIRKVDPNAPITEQDLDDIINWYESVTYGLRDLSYNN